MGLYPARAWERTMKVPEVILRAVSGKILWMRAAEILGICDTGLWVSLKAFPKEGRLGLMENSPQKSAPSFPQRPKAFLFKNWE